MHELELLSANSLRELVEGGVRIAVVPFGSVEHQGPHLPVGADALVGDWVGREAARRLDALLAPAVRIGDATAHAASDGTLSLRAETLADVASELASSLARLGLRTIALVSTHGGNAAPLTAAVRRLSGSLDEAVVCAPRGDLGPDPGSHSGEWLTSAMLAL